MWMDSNYGETNVPSGDDECSTDYKTSPPPGNSSPVGVSGYLDSHQCWKSHGELCVTPSPSKVPGSHLLVNKHLEGVIVSAVEDSVAPYKNHISLVTGGRSHSLAI